MFFSFACGIILMLVVLAAEGLRYISNGAVPSLIEYLAKWESKPKAHWIIHDDDVDEREEGMSLRE